MMQTNKTALGSFNTLVVTKPKAKLSLKDFIWSNVAARMLPSRTSSERLISEKVGKELAIQQKNQSVSWSQVDKDEFSKRISHMIHTEAFWAELSNVVGTPRVEESEDVFVNRAKAMMTNLIRSKMKM